MGEKRNKVWQFFFEKHSLLLESRTILEQVHDQEMLTKKINIICYLNKNFPKEYLLLLLVV
jgi:hypothetical protein